MITNLHIKNLGIIDDVELELGENFNSLTGDTGAGKSLIIDALCLISGGRFSKEMIKKGKDELFVEANILLENEENVVVSRNISINGKNVCKINGSIVSVNELKKYMDSIIDIHMQNDNNKLLDKKYHIEYVDSYNKEISNVKKEYQEYYFEYLKLIDELNKNLGDEKERKRTLDLLEYELNEIEEANLVETEEELENKHKIMQNSSKIIGSLNMSKEVLDENVISGLENCIRYFSKISDLNENYAKKLEVFQNSYYDLKDASEECSNMLDSLDINEMEAQNFMDRLDKIHSLKRKYGNTIDEILNYKEEIKEKIFKINNMEEYVLELNKRLDETKLKMNELCDKLHCLRLNYSNKISGLINKELLDMEMKGVEVKIEVNSLNSEEFNINGLDTVEFLIKTNVGGNYLPLIKIASGGEMARVMLGMKVVLANSYKGNLTLVLDEIDTGISGEAANRVAEKLMKISKNMQVICVTHLGNIAAVADSNFYIYKEVANGDTTSKVKLLNKEEKTNEIARIAFGKITKTAIEYALELQNKKVLA